MSTASNKRPEFDYTNLIDLTIEGCKSAEAAAAAVAEAVAKRELGSLEQVREQEEHLDMLDREINEGVTATVTRVSPDQARDLLACLKVILELERIGDLLLGVGNRLRSSVGRIAVQDTKDLAAMASLVSAMLKQSEKAFCDRDTKIALSIMRSDAEVDRLRNLLFVRHIENPEGIEQQESFHVVFMSQALERAGDHVKNIAEEVVQLVTGRSVRHLIRSNDKPFENMFVEWMRRRDAECE